MATGSWIRLSATEVSLDARNMNQVIRDVLGRRGTHSIAQDPAARQAVGQIYVDHANQFAPMHSGDLRRSGRATDDGRVYWTSIHNGFNYAEFQYYHTPYKNPTTPDTYPHWTDNVRPGTPEWSNFINDITPIIIARF